MLGNGWWSDGGGWRQRRPELVLVAQRRGHGAKPAREGRGHAQGLGLPTVGLVLLVGSGTLQSLATLLVAAW